jgi:hypothetical protein
MKITLFVLFFLCTAAAFGQTGVAVLSNQPQIVSLPDHPLHAEHHDLACEHPLVGGGSTTYTYAQGERPLWEFGSPNPEPTPLGDVARAYRKEKVAIKKAEKVLEKQGS